MDSEVNLSRQKKKLERNVNPEIGLMLLWVFEVDDDMALEEKRRRSDMM